jgi:signal transduction histidine kinase
VRGGTASRSSGLRGFQRKLVVAMMLVVSAVAAGLYLAERRVNADGKRDFEREFQGEVAALHAVQEVRHAMLAERCRALARRPRIHAALEDGALDLLYPSARDELADVMNGDEGPGRAAAPYALHARFYRFLDGQGAVIAPPDATDVGALRPGDQARLALPGLPDQPQLGYLFRAAAAAGETADEVFAMPIVSTETGGIIAAIVVGFKPIDLGATVGGAGIQSGLWVGGRLRLPGLSAAAQTALSGRLAAELADPERPDNRFDVPIDGAPYLLFYSRLNPGSQFPPAYEIGITPLAGLIARQRTLEWKFIGAGLLLLVGALGASQWLSSRLSAPVERLEVASAENLVQRQRAEAALDTTSRELQRAARFSADASHQLKTPVTVLRAGLEELLAAEQFSPEVREELAALVHQTLRLTNVIEDLLLLSRMDAGRVQLAFGAVNLRRLIDAWLDDLGTLPDALVLEVETDLPPVLTISGEQRYTTLIVQNLLENARKYNRAGGRIRIAAREEDGWIVLTIGNTGRPIPPAAQEHIFERFHRGTAGENVPGHGLGLNLASELARLHGGVLRLARSDEAWTEFEVRFRVASAVPQPARTFA